MSLERKLVRWEEAGLIDGPTRARILAFEHGDRKPVVLYALGVLGAGTVALGIVSLIAANWDAIPGSVKLGSDLIVGLALAAAIYRSVLSERSVRTEILVTLFYGFTLASLGLVGQVYQLGTPVYQALLLWTAATLPVVLLGRSVHLAMTVVTGLVTTHASALEGLFDLIQASASLGDAVQENLMAAIAFVSPLLYIPLGRIPWLVRERPEYARTLGGFAWLSVLACGFALQFLWYERGGNHENLSGALAATGGVVLLLVLSLPRLYPEVPAGARQTLGVILGFGWLTFALGTGFERDSADYVGALLQVAWLALFARAALQLGRVREFNALTALIAARVLAIYFEVFGSMLDTGLGLITGGLLTLLAAWLWQKQRSRLTGRTKAGGAPP